jgi:hypothetical protein
LMEMLILKYNFSALIWELYVQVSAGQ